MTLFDHYLEYMTQLLEGRRSPPEGITLPEGDMTEKVASLSRQLQQMGVAAFVRACARQDGVTLPEEIYRQADDTTSLQQLLQSAVQLAPVQEASPAEEPSETAPDPDAGKHAFEVFCDCLMLDENLIAYLIDVLKANDRAGFYKLSQVTTHLDLDPDEFLYWLAHREDYGTDDERACAAIMDACFARLYEEKQGELLGALLSGDQKTFELFRTEAPELRHLPAATYEWYSKNYLDRDYPLRFILMCNGVEFPDTPEEDK